jgi:hypothetical protein
MTKTSKLGVTVEDRTGVQARLAAWRARRQKGERIPAELWTATIEVARPDGTRVIVRLGALVESILRAGA